MGFFDLNIPYTDSTPPNKANSTSAKSTRIKIVIKAMELGYTGIAHNRTIKGIMSDRDRCSIPLITLSSLLNVSPYLSSSVNFHRCLLGIPRSSPFRQYTRLTVCIDNASQSQALNSGNPVLKTYDIVAVRPLNQNAFDHGCQRAEVDIISIDFSDKLPFRLKMPMVKAAIKRGVYFEITYSDLIVDVHRRRQVISNAKLLLDWTRGKNIIFSSAAPSVCEVRGPNDVANLASLLGLSMERTKAAISKNCRSLLTNALRRKHFFKEVIRVEAVSSSRPSDSETPWSMDWLKWDPISSGEGDLLLDEMAKSFSASNNVSKTVKAIDFESSIDKMPSHGFQVMDFVSITKASFQPPAKVKSFLPTPEPIELSVTADPVSENSIKHNLFPETDDPSLDNTCSEHVTSTIGDPQTLDLASYATKTSTGADKEVTNTITTDEEMEPHNASDVAFSAVDAENEGLHSEKCYEQNVELLNENVSSSLNAVMLNENIISHQTSAMDIELDAGALEISPPSENNSLPPTQCGELESSKGCHVDSGAETIKVDDVAVDVNMDAGALEISPPSENNRLPPTQGGEFESSKGCHVDSGAETIKVDDVAVDVNMNAGAMEISRPSDNNRLPPTQGGECETSKGCHVDSGAETIKADDVAVDMDMENQESSSLSFHNVPLPENISERIPSRASEDDTVIADKISLQQSDDETRVRNDFLAANHENRDLIMEEQKLAEGDDKTNDIASVISNESLHKNVIKRDPTTAHWDPFPESNQNMNAKGISSTISNEIQDVAFEMKRDAEDDGKTGNLTLGRRISGKSRRRHRNPRQAPLFPLRLNLYPVSFKRKAARNSERTVKM